MNFDSNSYTLSKNLIFPDYTNFVKDDQLYAYDEYCYYVNPEENPQSFSEQFISTLRCPFYESD